MKGLFTSEAVSIGHPDRLADFCVNAVLTEYCRQDKKSRVGLEALLSKDSFIIGGEVKSSAVFDVEEVVRLAVKTAGYDGVEGFSYDTFKFQSKISTQSPDINQGVDKGATIGAGDLILLVAL